MQTYYRQKPSEKALQNYKYYLEKLLEKDRIKIDIEPREILNKIDIMVDGQKMSEIYYWIDKINVRMDNNLLELDPNECNLLGIDETPTLDDLRQLASQIQENAYKRLGKKYA